MREPGEDLGGLGESEESDYYDDSLCFMVDEDAIVESFILTFHTLNSTTNLVWINVKPQWLIPRKRHILSPIIGKKGIELDYEEEEKEEEKEDGASTSITNDEVKLLGGMFALVIKQQTQQSTNIALHDTK
jgi:hypothetical protein